jgi:glucosamine-phosphate N-acetyltransferase
MTFAIGELTKKDLSRGFLESLAELGKVELTAPEVANVFQGRVRTGVRTFVARDGDKVIGTASLILEQKFYHRGGHAGHIEDVSIHRDYQGRGVGAALVRHAIEEARRLGCYKVILNCDDRVMPFYVRLGFHRHSNGMRLDFQVIGEP